MAEFGSLSDEPPWPEEASPPLVFLLDASSSFERAILENWVIRHRPQGAPAEVLGISGSRRRSRREAMTLALEARARRGDNPTLVPLRVVWLPPERDGRRTFRVGDLVRFGDIRDPDPIRERWLYRYRRELVRIVVGSSATAYELRARWESGFAPPSSFGEFTTRQAHLALERSERRVRGSRYKVPRFVREEILSRADFQQQLARLASETSQSPAEVRARAARYLREIAATTNTYTVDVVASTIRWLYRRGYRDLHYDPDAFAEVARLSEQFPVVYLPSHKSHFDHLILAYLLWENGLPPNHTAGGINMDFIPMGPIMRRTGVFFIRRSFRGDDVYRETLKAYLDYLIEKRFPLEWYLEGGRSRSGKLLAPRYGMLGYVADAYWRGKSEDVSIIPVSIAYDQIQEVGSHAAEQRGDPKERESVGWMVRAVRSFRGRYGSIHIRLGEPLSLRKELGELSGPERRLLDVQKLAFEVLVRIGRATTVTEPSLVVSALLSAGERSQTVAQLRADVAGLAAHVRRLSLPLPDRFEPASERGLRANLDLLHAQGLVEVYEGGREPVYRIAERRRHEAAYYRNTIAHFFVAGAISEVALVAASEEDGGGREAFWAAVEQWRDLLKFEFFFPPRASFQEQVRVELDLQDPTWEEVVEQGRHPIQSLLARIRPLRAHWILRPWLDGYIVVAESMTASGPHIDRDSLLKSSHALGRQYLLQRRIATPESISNAIFESGLALAENRGLLDETDPRLGEKRSWFLSEIRRSQVQIGFIEQISEARRMRSQ